MNDKIKVFALGGLDEKGKNLLIVEINDNIFNHVYSKRT